MNRLSILLTCHTRRDKTIHCLEQLFAAVNQLSDIEVNVFLVDDGSTDGTAEAIKIQFPKVNIIKGDGNLFWNRGMNLAWNEATEVNPDFYLWLNDDTFLFENSLHSLLESSFQKENQSIIVGSTVSENNNEITYGGRNRNGKLIKPNGELQMCNHFNGNIVLIPKSVFEKNGYLDSTFHHALGDIDYGLRANKVNIESYVANDFVGICEGHITLPKWFDSEIKTLGRFKSYYSTSCGSNPIQLFRFENRHHGFLKALKSLITNHLQVFNPTLMNKFKNS